MIDPADELTVHRWVRPLLGDLGGSVENDRCRERDSMILRPRRTQRLSRPIQHLARSSTKDPAGLLLHVLVVVAMDCPATPEAQLSEHLSVHDRISLTLVGGPTHHGNVIGKVLRP